MLLLLQRRLLLQQHHAVVPRDASRGLRGGRVRQISPDVDAAIFSGRRKRFEFIGRMHDEQRRAVLGNLGLIAQIVLDAAVDVKRLTQIAVTRERSQRLRPIQRRDVRARSRPHQQLGRRRQRPRGASIRLTVQ